MTVTLYTPDGDEAGEVDLPEPFEARVRTDLIHKAVTVARANRAQPYGVDPKAGKRYAVEGMGPGHGISRVPRLTRSQRAAFAPGTVGGRRAHPPKAEKDLSSKINDKERRKALVAAWAATADVELVRERGHRVPGDMSVPVVVEDGFVDVERTRDVIAFFEAVGLGDELDRADKRTVRAGKGKGRGRRYRSPRSALIVVHEDGRIVEAARNLPGIEVAQVEHVGAHDLAPGGDAGRLVVATESALEAIR